MASTETRTGFRLPWVSDAHPTSDAAPDAGEVAEATQLEDADAAEVATTAAADGADDPGTRPDDDEPQQVQAPRPAPAGAPRRPTKFLADLTRAMRSAAEAEREDILGRFKTDAKTFTETIHERSAVEATELRAASDSDIAGIRDWSKAEIARIREETEHRIGERHARLDGDIEAHAARIERRIEHVQTTVETFEAEMGRFFETLFAEDDPSRFAELAANLPEPPSLEVIAGEDVDIPEPVAEVAPAVEEVPAVEETTAVAGEAAEGALEIETEPVAADAATEGAATDTEPEALAADVTAETQGEVEPIVAEAVAEATGPAEQADELTEPAQATEPAHAGATFDEDALTLDPRVAALGLTPDFGAAEAEAAQLAGDLADDGSGEAIPAFDEETIAARLAGLVPAGAPEPTDLVETLVTVSGLVSVASIAGFKRGLGRMPGIQSVSVSSGPDGEFIFSVSRSASTDLASAITTMPGFSARVTSATDDRLEVTARDPDAA